MTPPRWVRVVVALLGLALLTLGVVGLFSPHALFGPDGYRIPVRVAVGLLGAVAFGLGVAALAAAAGADAAALQSISLALLVTATIIPPVVLYNVGYFDRVDTGGLRAFSIIGAVILAAGVPLLLNMRVLHRIRTAPRRRPVDERDQGI